MEVMLYLIDMDLPSVYSSVYEQLIYIQTFFLKPEMKPSFAAQHDSHPSHANHSISIVLIAKITAYIL